MAEAHRRTVSSQSPRVGGSGGRETFLETAAGCQNFGMALGA